MMKSAFNRIGIIARVNSPGVKESLNALIQYLLELKSSLVVESETAELIPNCTLNQCPKDQLAQHCDLIIVIGGDGSLLHAAHLVVENEVPLLGVNRGSLGFLTDILPKELYKIKDILAGKYKIEKRFFLTSTIENQNEIIGSDDALNEVALIPDLIPHMLEFEIYINDQFVCSHDSDGLIIATPTGSTAYALSGGGPILHPQLDAIVLVPMFPHTLTSRPIVIEGTCQIRIIISKNNKTSPRVSCDGRAYINTPPGSHITVRKKSKMLHLIHPLDYHYYETLRSKLHWGKKLNYME